MVTQKLFPKLCPFQSESNSELSLSGFETVASNSFDEEEEEEDDDKKGSVMLSIPYSWSSSMFQEDRHGDKDEIRPEGITRHRSAVQHTPNLFLNVPLTPYASICSS